MNYAFSEPFPLRYTALNRSSALNNLSTTCCASRPPRVSNASRAKPPKKKRARPRTRATQTQKREPTVADLSAQISQTIGLHIIKSDLDNLYSFFRSFVKVKTMHNEHLSSQPATNTKPPADASHKSESGLEHNEIQAIVSSDGVENGFVPKSMLGKAVVSNYVAVRGSLDRTMETISLATQSLLLRMIATAGSTMYSILEAGERAFPALDFSSAKRTTQQMIEHGWNPLKSFQWQAAAMSDARQLRDNRRERVEYVKGYLRGKTGGPWAHTIMFASRGVSTTFSVFENVTPELIHGASRLASAGYGGLKAIGHWGAMRSEPSELKKNGPRALGSLRAGFAFLDKLPPLPSKSTKETVRRKKAPLVPGKDSSLHSKSSSDVMKLSLSLFPNGMRGTKLDDSGRSSGENSKVRNVDLIDAGKPSDMLEKGGAILGAGMLLMATSGISLPAAVTCSAIMITTIGVAQANAAVNENGIHQDARAAFRQSISVRKLEKILPRRRAPKKKLSKREDKSGLVISQSKQDVLSPESSEVKVRHDFENLVAEAEDDVVVDVDVQAHSIGQSEPNILSAPVFGTLLNATDYTAYRIETISGRLFSRLETVIGIRQKSTTWVLLKSFQRKS